MNPSTDLRMLCHHFDAGRCGSCRLIETPYAVQVGAKQRHVADLLADHPSIEWAAPVRSAEAGFRNKAKLVVAGAVEEPTLGILDRDWQGVDLQDCPLYPPELSGCFPTLAEFVTRSGLAPYDVRGRRGTLKYFLVTVSPDAELMLRVVVADERDVEVVRNHLDWLQERVPQLAVVSVNIHPEHKAVLEGDREIVLTERDHLPMRLERMSLTGGPVGPPVELRLRTRSFFQTNTDVARALYAQAAEWVDQVAPVTLWDLYCGVGGFALHCAAPGRRVVGVEVSDEAVVAAQESAAASGIDAQFLATDATAFALDAGAGAASAPDLVIVNPPRRGIGIELAAKLESSGVDHVIYSSCNAASLAKDLAAMPSFRVTKARLLDMFPHTHHYEVIVLLERNH